MSDQTILWRTLRVMPNAGTTADPDWRGSGLTPNNVTIQVTGSASSGVYSVRVRGQILRPNGSGIELDETVSMTRTSQSNAQIAAALESNADANGPLVDAGIIFSVSSDTLTVVAPPTAALTFATSAPGSGSFTLARGSVLPICASSPSFAGSRYHLGSVVLQVNALDSDGDLLAPGTGTQTSFDLAVVEVCAIKDARGNLTYRIARTATVTGCNLATEYAFPVRGAGYWTARISNLADAVASTAAYEFSYRDATS